MRHTHAGVRVEARRNRSHLHRLLHHHGLARLLVGWLESGKRQALVIRWVHRNTLLLLLLLLHLKLLGLWLLLKVLLLLELHLLLLLLLRRPELLLLLLLL